VDRERRRRLGRGRGRLRGQRTPGGLLVKRGAVR
jgi:hypothetical protein